MSEKKCVVYPIHLKPHPESDKLHIGEVGGHQVVVGVHYEEGTLGIYIPDGAILPDDIAEDMWLKGKLAGSKKNRVKGQELRWRFLRWPFLWQTLPRREGWSTGLSGKSGLET